MTAESPKAPESKARMAWSLDNRHQAFLADRDGTGGRYDPVEASAPAGRIRTEDLGAGGGR